MLGEIVKKDINLIIFGSLTILIVIIIGIVSSAQILKEETIQNQLTLSKLNGKFLAENLNQSMNNIELLIENISSLIDLEENEEITNKKLENTLDRFPIIRSINILDDNKIKYSSSKLNIGLLIHENEFFPKPLFSNNILRVSYPWVGRDFISGSSILLSDEIPDDYLSFIPILKQTYINNKKLSVIINLNNDFILSKFKERSSNNKLEITLLRTDNILLLSNKQISSLGKKSKTSSLLKSAYEFNQATGIETINNTKQISTYNLTEDYPFIISIHLDYEDSLLTWKEKSYNFFIISISIVIVCMLIVLSLILLYRKEKEKEILLHKQQIEDQEKFKRLFHDSHFLSMVIDRNGAIIDINDSALKFINTKLENTIKKPFWELSCWGYDEKRYIKKLFKNKNQEININEEIKAFNSSKKNCVLEISIYTINKESNEYKYIAIAQDITQRKKREEKLSQAYTVFNHTRDGIMITDKDTNIIDVNNAFEFITGYTKNEILGKNTRTLKSNIHDEDFYTDIWDSLNTRRYWEGEITNTRKDRSFYTEWLTINAILDAETNVVNYIGIFSDITDSKQKELLLKEKEAVIYQQSKMASMGEMIGNIAHQWRQPLSLISTAATGMKMQKEFGTISQEDEIKNLDSINEAAQFLSETINDFRDFLNKDKELEDFSLQSVFDSAIKLISSKLNNRNIQIINNIEDTEIYGLKNEFIQVIINIINNANDALENSKLENKYIFINSEIKENDIIIDIKNNGGPIPDEIIDRIFEPYFTTKHQSQGTGIGLYMSIEIITNHMKGTLSVKNEMFSYQGEDYLGPCFKIKIPL